MPCRALRIRPGWLGGTTVLVLAASIVLMLGLSVAPNSNSWGDFARVFKSGVLNEKNYFGNAGDFPAGDRFRANSAVRFQFIAGADGFKCNASYSSGCRRAAPASAIPHRDSEHVATASERSTGCVGKGKPHG